MTLGAVVVLLQYKKMWVCGFPPRLACVPGGRKELGLQSALDQSKVTVQTLILCEQLLAKYT